MKNTKQNASLHEKIKFLCLTYSIVILCWFLCTQLAAYLAPSLESNNFIQSLAHFDIYKLVIFFLIFFFLGSFLEKQSKVNGFPLLLLRFIIITIIIICVNIRWTISYNSEYFSYIYKMILITMVSQLLRSTLLIFAHKKNVFLRKYDKGISRLLFSIFISIIVYLVFTITERTGQNTTVLKIDQLLIQYLKYPFLLLIFSADNAFSEYKATAKNFPYDLYDTKISEPIRSASVRLRFFLFVYILIAGSVLSEALLRDVF